MNVNKLAHDLIYGKNVNSLAYLHDRLNLLVQSNVHTTESIASSLIGLELLNEIAYIHANETGISINFGKTLRELKCVIEGEDCLKKVEIFLQYCGPKKLIVKHVELPDSPLQHTEYRSLEEVIVAFKRYILNLTNYFYALERIDQLCTVMEPPKPSFKDDYRRIFIDDRTWLHVEVTKDGLATNVHLIGQCEMWQDKLQKGLLTWNHDKDIVENIMDIFEFSDFPSPGKNKLVSVLAEQPTAEEVLCSICLCAELPDIAGIPQPLCQNTYCGVYFHRNCLFQWLVACLGGKLPTFGVVTGSCPSCLEPIMCNEKDG